MANGNTSGREVHRIDKIWDNRSEPSTPMDNWKPHLKLVFETGDTAKVLSKDDWAILEEGQAYKLLIERGVYNSKPWAKVLGVLGPADPTDVEAINAKFPEKGEAKPSGGGSSGSAKGGGGDYSPARVMDIRTQTAMKIASEIVSAKIAAKHFRSTVEGEEVFVDKAAMENFAVWVEFVFKRLDSGKWEPGGGEGDIPF